MLTITPQVTSLVQDSNTPLGGAITLASTTNQVTVTQSGQTFTFSTPQDIATTSTPTFSELTLTNQTAGNVVLTVSGASSQSVNLSDWKDSSGNILLSVTKEGFLQLIPTDSSYSTHFHQIFSQNIITISADINEGFFNFTSTLKASVAQTNAVCYNWKGIFQNTAAYTGDIGNLAGFSDGSILQSQTVSCSADTYRSFYTTTNVKGLVGTTMTLASWNVIEIGGIQSGGSAITTRRGVYIKDVVKVGGTLTTDIGLQLDDIASGGTTNIAIYQTGTSGNNRFLAASTFGADQASVGQVDVITSGATVVPLRLIAAASQSANTLGVFDSSLNVLSRFDATGQLVISDNTNAISATPTFIAIGNATSKSVTANISASFVAANTTFVFTATQSGFGGHLFFQHNVTYKNNTSLTGNLGAICTDFYNQPLYTGDTNATTALTSAVNGGFYEAQRFSTANSGTLTATNVNSFVAFPSSGTGVTITNRRGVYIRNCAGGTITNHYGLLIEDLANAGGTTTQAITVLGTTAHSRHVPNITFGTDTLPGALVDFAGKMLITSSGLVTKYNNISTVSNGVPSELATVDLTTQSAAITATTLYTPAATGLFRISIYLQVTRAASTSSILGGATGVVITYNDGDGNVAQSDTAGLFSTAGAVVTTINTNSTATNLEGSMVIYARTGVAIQYAIGYTSVGLTAMQFAAHLKIEAL